MSLHLDLEDETFADAQQIEDDEERLDRHHGKRP